MSLPVLVLWPDGPRYVPAEKVIGWAGDSYWDHADRYVCRECGRDSMDELEGCDHEETDPVYDEPTPKPETLEDAIAWLDDTGEVTFGNPMIHPEPGT